MYAATCLILGQSCAQNVNVCTSESQTVQVLSRVISVQLESSFIGSIRPIEEVVVDKVGLYAYPMQTHGRQQLYSWSTFQNALVVSVHLEHRTKIVHVHTPYKLVNKCPLLLRFKVRSGLQVMVFSNL